MGVAPANSVTFAVTSAIRDRSSGGADSRFRVLKRAASAVEVVTARVATSATSVVARREGAMPGKRRADGSTDLATRKGKGREGISVTRQIHC